MVGMLSQSLPFKLAHLGHIVTFFKFHFCPHSYQHVISVIINYYANKGIMMRLDIFILFYMDYA